MIFRRGIFSRISVLVLLGVVAGCAPIPCEEYSEGQLDLDFAPIVHAADLAFDATDVLAGKLKADAYIQKHSAPGVQIQIFGLRRYDILYALLTDEAAGVQTLVVPGTSNFENFEEDLENRLVHDRELNIELHLGWRNIARGIRDDAAPRLRSGYALRVYGYSLGGAVAAILGLYYQDQGLPLVEVITFGQPRITDSSGVDRIRQLPLTRLISAGDPVPAYPLGRFWRHASPAFVVLDGPCAAYLEPDDPLINDHQSVPEILTQDAVEAHLTYPQRLRSKLDITVLRVPQTLITQ